METCTSYENPLSTLSFYEGNDQKENTFFDKRGSIYNKSNINNERSKSSVSFYKL